MPSIYFQCGRYRHNKDVCAEEVAGITTVGARMGVDAQSSGLVIVGGRVFEQIAPCFGLWMVAPRRGKPRVDKRKEHGKDSSQGVKGDFHTDSQFAVLANEEVESPNQGAGKEPDAPSANINQPTNASFKHTIFPKKANPNSKNHIHTVLYLKHPVSHITRSYKNSAAHADIPTTNQAASNSLARNDPSPSISMQMFQMPLIPPPCNICITFGLEIIIISKMTSSIAYPMYLLQIFSSLL